MLTGFASMQRPPVDGVVVDLPGDSVPRRCSVVVPRESYSLRVSLMARGDSMENRRVTTKASQQDQGLKIVPLPAGAAALHQFDTDTVGRGDITQPSPPDPFLECHGKAHPFGAQLVAEGAQVAVI